METSTYVTDKFLANRYSTHRTTVWRWVRSGKFPQPIKLSEGCTRWKLSDIEAHDKKMAVAK